MKSRPMGKKKNMWESLHYMARCRKAINVNPRLKVEQDFFLVLKRIFTRDDVVSQRLGFGRWIFFLGVTNWHVFLTFPFPVPLAQGSRDVPKNCAILLAVTLRITCTSGWVEHKQARQSTRSILATSSSCLYPFTL